MPGKYLSSNMKVGIQRMVDELYNLTPEEIDFVEDKRKGTGEFFLFIDKKEFKIYSGFGPHNEMLTLAYVEENARLIKRILEKVYVDKYN